MDEVLVADRAELAGAEHAGHRTLRDLLVDQLGVVIGLAEEVAAPTVAGEHEGRGARLTLKEVPQVLVRAVGVADLELDGRAHLGDVA